MDQLRIDIDSDPSADDIARLAAGLTEHSLPAVGRRGFLPLAAFVRDADGSLRGGISGVVNWNWLHVQLVWVDASLRHGGLGSKLLRAFEAAGMERGCRMAHLDTFSYQARPFYERHGYELFATLEDYPPGQSRYFLKKTLAA